jgi:dynein heavy chain
MRIFDHIDLLTREVFMPLLCTETNMNHQADKLMDTMHRIISQLAVAQSQVEDSVSLPLPALNLLAMIAANPSRRLSVLHILETTLINWQKQIKNALKQQPEMLIARSAYFTGDEIKLWTGYINKLNNLIVQLDAPHVKDILTNLENNHSAYIQPFYLIKNDIKAVSLLLYKICLKNKQYFPSKSR